MNDQNANGTDAFARKLAAFSATLNKEDRGRLASILRAAGRDAAEVKGYDGDTSGLGVDYERGVDSIEINRLLRNGQIQGVILLPSAVAPPPLADRNVGPPND